MPQRPDVSAVWSFSTAWSIGNVAAFGLAAAIAGTLIRGLFLYLQRACASMLLLTRRERVEQLENTALGIAHMIDVSRERHQQDGRDHEADPVTDPAAVREFRGGAKAAFHATAGHGSPPPPLP